MTNSRTDEDPPAWLANSPLFEGLNEQALEWITAAATRVHCDAGHILFFQDDPGDALYLIEKGSVEISVISANGKKLSLNVMRPGDIFGEIAVLDGGARTATATVLEQASFLSISRAELMRIMLDHPEVAVELVAMLCNRLRWVSQLVEDLGLLEIQERLASRLMILDRTFSDYRGKLPLSQSELADFLGATRESINKALRGWQDEGLINLSRGCIHILDRGGLADLAMNKR